MTDSPLAVIGILITVVAALMLGVTLWSWAVQCVDWCRRAGTVTWW